MRTLIFGLIWRIILLLINLSIIAYLLVAAYHFDQTHQLIDFQKMIFDLLLLIWIKTD